MRLSAILLLSASAAAALSAGCGGRSRAESVDPRSAAYVEVQNQSFYDMTIYLVRSETRVRLGNVSSLSTQVFEIPRTFVNPGLPIRFMADPIGSQRTPFSNELAVFPGDTVKLRIPPP